MSLKKNTLANFAGNIYSAVIGIFMVPFYLRYLGPEGYGLVGFFSVMNSWLCLLDSGLSPTISRETASARAGALEYSDLRKLLRSVEFFFLILSCLIFLTIWLAKDFLAANWLQVKELSHSEVALCVGLMGLMVGIRWFVSVYKSGLIGFEEQIWLNFLNISFSTFRFLGAYILLRFVSQTISSFFYFQTLLSFLELLFINRKIYAILPGVAEKRWVLLRPIRRVLPFAGGIAYTAAIWIVITQMDKLMLSHFLSLREYGYFALAAMVANYTQNMSDPVRQALLPRMTFLCSQKKTTEMLVLYRKASQLMSVVIFPLVCTIAIFSKELLFFWTGSKTLSIWASPILTWYVFGNGLMAVSAFQYYLQFAYGKVRLHVIFNTFSFLITVPTVFLFTKFGGGLGAAFAWFVLRLFSFLIYVPIVHKNFAPGLHASWLIKDIVPFFVFPFSLLKLIHLNLPEIENLSRIAGFVCLLLIGGIVLFLNCLISNEFRKHLKKIVNKFYSETKLDCEDK